MLKESDKIKVHMMDVSFDREIKTRNFNRIFTVERDPETGKLGIDWYGHVNRRPDDEIKISPFDTFSWNIIFENIETGARCYYDSVNHCLTPCGPHREITPEEFAARIQ